MEAQKIEVGIGQFRHESPVESNEELKQRIKEMQQNGRYFIAMWSIQDGQLNFSQVMRDFPTSDLYTCNEQLQDLMNKTITENVTNVGSLPPTKE